MPHGHGGKRAGAGRPKGIIGVPIAKKRAAEEVARAMIERNIEPVMQKYLQLCAEGNPLIIKHYMDRVIPPRAPEDREGRALIGETVIVTKLGDDD